jgi:hypothetical protein
VDRGQQQAFERLKHVLQEAPVLAHPDPSLPYYLNTDASGYAVSAVLSQDHGRGRQPVAYFSRKMESAQKRYPVHEQELLAIVLALEEWRCYLHGSVHPVSVLSDHRSLQWISTQPTLSSRQARWVEQLQEYEFNIEYVEGKENRVADALSRRSDYEKADSKQKEDDRRDAVPQSRLRLSATTAAVAPADKNRLSATTAAAAPADKNRLSATTAAAAPADKNSTTAGNVEATLLQDIHDAALRDDEYQLRLSKAAQMGLKVEAGLLYTEDGILHIPADREIQQRILHELHDTPTGGHLGVSKTTKKLRQRLYWYGMDRDALEYVRSCVTCSTTKPKQQLPAGKLVPIPIPSRPWQTITMDFLGPLPRTSNFHDMILIVDDKLTKMAHFIPTNREVTAKQVAQLVLREVVRLHGVPESIISDRDPRFTSDFWKELWKQLGTELRMSTSYHPQSDGQSERTIRVLEDMLRAYVNRHRTNWDEYLTPVEIAYNSAEHSSTGFTPYHLNGGSMALPIDRALGVGSQQQDVPAVDDLVSEIRQHLEDARLLLLKRQETQKKYADQRRTDERYAVNDEVMLSTKHIARKGKLKDVYSGPYRVAEVRGDVNVRLDLPTSMQKLHPWFHVDKLKRYVRSAVNWPRRQQDVRPPPVLLDGEEYFEIEKIVGRREEEVQVQATDDPAPAMDGRRVTRKRAEAMRQQLQQQPRTERIVKYLVKWKGWDDEHNSWKTDAELDHARELVEEYERQQQDVREQEELALMVITPGTVLGPATSARPCVSHTDDAVSDRALRVTHTTAVTGCTTLEDVCQQATSRT